MIPNLFLIQNDRKQMLEENKAGFAHPEFAIFS
jgi:hypothetical protein